MPGHSEDPEDEVIEFSFPEPRTYELIDDDDESHGAEMQLSRSVEAAAWSGPDLNHHSDLEDEGTGSSLSFCGSEEFDDEDDVIRETPSDDAKHAYAERAKWTTSVNSPLSVPADYPCGRRGAEDGQFANDAAPENTAQADSIFKWLTSGELAAWRAASKHNEGMAMFVLAPENVRPVLYQNYMNVASMVAYIPLKMTLVRHANQMVHVWTYCDMWFASDQMDQMCVAVVNALYLSESLSENEKEMLQSFILQCEPEE